MADKKIDERHLVTYVSIPDSQHIVSREGGTVVGRGVEAKKTAVQREDEIPDEVSSVTDNSQPELKAEKKPLPPKDAPRPEQPKVKKEEPLSSNPNQLKGKDGKQKTGCLLMMMLIVIFVVIALVVLIQSTKRGTQQPVISVTTPSIETNIGDENSSTAVAPDTVVSGRLMAPNEVTTAKGDLEDGLKLVLGAAAFLAFLAVLFGSFVFFTREGMESKMRAKKFLIVSTILLAVLLIVNGVVIAYFAIYKDRPVSDGTSVVVNYYSDWDSSAPLDIEFDVTGLPEAQTARFISWNFGDGSNGSGPKVRHVYNSLGNFEAKAVFTLPDGSNKVYTRNISINNILPTVKIDTSEATGLAPLTVEFDGAGSSDKNGTILDYQWVFPDGTTKAGVAASYTFEEKGEYEVLLKVTDNNLEAANGKVIITVTDEGLPQAVIKTDPDSARGRVPFKVLFAGGDSADQNGNIIRYQWDFGDGSPKENGQNANHIFEKAGSYVTELTVWDDDGMSGKATVEIEAVKQFTKPVPDFSMEIDGLEEAPMKVILDGGASTDSDGTVVSYQWDFGDQSESETGQRVEHTYGTSGQYELVLTVTDDDGVSAAKREMIKVQAPEPTPPVIVLVVDPDPATVNIGQEVKFNASQSYDLDGHIISYEWDFGDRTVRLGPAEISHDYDKVGIYTVKLTAHDDSGMTSKVETRVAVGESSIEAEVVADKTSGQVPLVVQFEAAGTEGSAVSYEWDFGDGLKSGRRNPLHIFTDTGEYTVKLQLTDAVGVVTEDSVVIKVMEK